MKKICVYVLLCFSFFSSSHADYELSDIEKTKINRAVQVIQNFVDEKWERYQAIISWRIDTILEKKNLSDRSIATLIYLKDGIDGMCTKWTCEQDNSEDIEISDDDFAFLYNNPQFDCNTNPCTTMKDAIKIVGEVDNDLVANIEVDEYRLKSYKWSNWEYNADVDYDNFETGENVYTINYLASDDTVLYSEKFIIKKIEEEEKQEVTMSSDANIQSGGWYEKNIPWVNIDEVRTYWLWLINAERSSIWLANYSYDSSLDTTAQIWSNLAKSRWYIDHKVNSPSDSYYDYWKKATWMTNNGVTCENISRITFSESIGWQTYSCSAGNDCTASLKKAVKSTFDFYMSEKWTSYDPHYRAIAQPLFETMWLWISVVDQWNNRYKMYLTNHYCTKNIQ